MKRFKKTLKTGALVLGLLLALLLIGNAIVIWITGSRLEERLAAIRNAGEPVTLSDLARPTPPPDQNAAVFLRRARDEVEALTKQINHIEGDPAREGRSVEAEQKSLRAALDAYPRVLPILEQAAACSHCNLELAYAAGTETLLNSLLDEVQRFRQYTNILRAQAQSLRAQGKRDDALRWCLVSFQLTRHLEREPLLISYLVVVACRSVAIGEVNAILRAGPVSDTVRAQLDKELVIGADADMRGYEQALKGERAYGISSFGTSTPLTWLNRAFFNNDECYMIDGINEQIGLVAQPYAAVAASEARLKQQGSPYLHPLATLLFPAVVKTREAMERSRAQIRCLRILNALQQHGPWHEKEPKLSKLGLPPEAITDPYDGSPIKLKQVNGDWLIYCVGPNLKDDGGQIESYADIGLGPVPGNSR